jgi:hypothetical protein
MDHYLHFLSAWEESEKRRRVQKSKRRVRKESGESHTSK